MFSLLMVCGQTVSACETNEYFDIPIQSVNTALLRFAQQARVPILFPSGSFSEVKANRLLGEYCIEDALEVLLQGTNVEASIDKTNQLLVSVIVQNDTSTEAANIEPGDEMSIQRPKRSILATAIAVVAASMTVSNVVTAQDDIPEEIVVTGSRIERSGMTTPNPVTTVTLDELKAMAPGTLIEGMSQLPQFYGGTTTADTNGFFGTPGAGSLNLRGLATKRTLSLLNGRRVVSSTIFGGPDINLFPEAILKNVETVTGGATAAYGTDAVSGVVNFILDTDFTGFKAQVQTGQTAQGDNDNYEVSLAAGFDLGERSHLLLSVENYEQDPVSTFTDRDWYQGWGLVRNTAAGAGDSNSNPRNLVLPNVVSTVSSYDGVLLFPTSSGIDRTIFNEDGTASSFDYGSTVGTNNHSITDGGSGTDNNADRPNLQASSERQNLFGYVDFDINDSLTVYAQGIYSEAAFKSTNLGGVFQGRRGMTIYQDNAFLPDDLRQSMIDNNVDSVAFGRIGHVSDLAVDAFVEQDTTTWSTTYGFEKDIVSDGFFDGWSVDGYFQYGETEALAKQTGIRADRIYLAMDAVVDPSSGEIVCNVTLTSGMYQDCVPLNLFGRGNASEAAVDWVTGFDVGLPVSVTPYLPGYPDETYSYISTKNKVRVIDLEQTVFEITAQGEISDGWGAGAISMAAGYHWREETLDQKVQAAQGNPAADPFVFPIAATDPSLGIRGVPTAYSGNSVETQFSKVPFARGKFDVSELFSEVYVPLVSDQNLIEQLDFTAAARWANYSGSGKIWSWKGGLDWSLNDQLRLRGTISRDVRAATLGERFDRSGGIATIDDWGEDINNPPTYQILIVSGGNPNVNPEEADTVVVGGVYQPGWMEGLSMSLDWYKVELEGSIESPNAQSIIDACYRQGDNDQCANIERNAPGNQISLVNQSFQNISGAKVSGVDFEISYLTDVSFFGGDELINLRLLGSYLGENSTTSSEGITTDRAGQTGGGQALPEWKYNASITYSNGPFSGFLQGRLIGEGLLSATNNLPNATTGEIFYDVADNTVDSAFYVDMRFGYAMDLDNGSNVEFFANINNLFDEDPPLVPSYSTFTGSPGQTNASLFDLLGRRFTIGVSFNY